jgi:hypothetical protein
MKKCTHAHGLLLSLGFWTTAMADSPALRVPQHPLSECLDPDRIRAWHLVDSDEVLVDAGRRHFRLHLPVSCPELNHTHQVGFRAGNNMGRICGNIGDAILGARGNALRYPCRIGIVEPLDAAQFEAALRRGPRDNARGIVTVRDSNEPED